MADKKFFEEEYNLRANPFFDYSYGPQLVDRKEIRAKLYEKLGHFVESPSPQLMSITGQYGVGKTFTLLEIKDDIKHKTSKFIKPDKLLCCYIRMTEPKVPSNYILYLYQQIVRGLGLETFKQLFDEYQEILTKNRSASNSVSKLSKDFRKVFARIQDNETSAWEYLRGGKVSPSSKKELQVDGMIDSDETAKIFIFDILKLMKILDYKALIILIDEFENVFTLAGGKKTAQILIIYRDIFDEINKLLYDDESICKTITIFASTASTGEDLKKLIHDKKIEAAAPFIDRVINENLNLPPFDKTEYVEKLISIKLNAYRVKEVDGIKPFKEDYIEYIKRITGGVPRYILQYSATILDSAADKGYKNIGAKEAEEIVIEKNL